MLNQIFSFQMKVNKASSEQISNRQFQTQTKILQITMKLYIIQRLYITLWRPVEQSPSDIEKKENLSWRHPQ